MYKMGWYWWLVGISHVTKTKRGILLNIEADCKRLHIGYIRLDTRKGSLAIWMI